MSNVEVSAVPVSAPVYPPSVAPDWVIEPRQTPKFISHKKKRSSVAKPTIHYPESDGMPMAESTAQYDNLTTTKGNIEFLYKRDPNVFVAGDLFWYPVKGRNDIVYAPDILIAFGPPKGKRGSYRQWEEGGIPPQVVFEIWSPGNRQASKDAKFAFYNRYGVEEYYTYDPDKGEMEGWVRKGGHLQKISEMSGWRSPRLDIQFTVEETPDGPEMQLYHPDGTRFTSHEEDIEMKQEAEAQAKQDSAARAKAEARVKQESTARMEAESKIEQEAAARVEAETKVKQESTARAESEAKMKQESTARMEAETKVKQESTARAEAEAKVKQESTARAEAEAQAEQAKALLRVAMEQLKKAGLSLPDDMS